MGVSWLERCLDFRGPELLLCGSVNSPDFRVSTFRVPPSVNVLNNKMHLNTGAHNSISCSFSEVTSVSLFSSLAVWLMAPVLICMAAVLTLPIGLLLGLLLFFMRVRHYDNTVKYTRSAIKNIRSSSFKPPQR